MGVSGSNAIRRFGFFLKLSIFCWLTTFIMVLVCGSQAAEGPAGYRPAEGMTLFLMVAGLFTFCSAVMSCVMDMGVIAAVEIRRKQRGTGSCGP